MDWTELSNRLADGAKVYKAFQDGANAASMLGSLERSRIELQAKYDQIEGQYETAKAGLDAILAQTKQMAINASRALADQQAEWDAAHAKQVNAAQVELDGWANKIAVQASNYAAEARSWKDRVALLTNQASQLDEQIQSLIRVRDSLKAQLQSVV